MKAKFQFHAKTIGNTALEIAAVGGGMILTKKFFDFNTLFKKQIEADPNFANRWFIRQQGWIRFGVGLAAASYVKNPWLKLIALGVATEGFITGVRSLSGGFFDAIGKTGQANNNQATPPADSALLELSRKIDEQTSGVNPVYEYGSNVAGMNPTTEYPSSVAGNGNSVVDLTDSIPMTTAGFGEWGSTAADWAA